MFNQQSPQPSAHHHLRFYIVMITVIVGSIFILLLMNNNPDSRLSITSAVVNVKNSSLFQDTASMEEYVEGKDLPNPADKNRVNDVFFALSSNSIPTVHQGMKAGEINLLFSDLSTAIKVNSDKLELNDLDEVTLNLKEFIGTLNFDGDYVSLDGTARRLEVNGIALSSHQDIKIVFSNLNYNGAMFKDTEFSDLQFSTGDGTLDVSGRLDYYIERDQSIFIDNYEGSVNIGKEMENATLFTMEGSSRSIDVVGGSNSFNLR